MKNRSTFIISTLFYCIFLINAAGAQELANGREIYIDPLNVKPLTATEAIDEVNYIPLETTSESRITAIDKLSVTDKYYIIQEQNTNRILLFNRDGKFHCKIDLKPYSGPFTVNNFKKEIVVTWGRMNFYYNFNGKYLRRESQITIGSPHFFANGSTGYIDYRVSEKYLNDTITHEYRVTANGKETGRFMPYNMKYATIQNGDDVYTWHTPIYETGSNTAAFYCRPFDYSIYQLSAYGINKAYQLTFPQENTLSDIVFSTDSLKGHRYTYFKSHNKQVSGISYVYKTGNNLFFRLDSWSGGLNGNDSYVYNLKTTALISLKNVTPDASNYNLPLTDIFYGGNFNNRNFLTSDGKYVYTSLKSDLMFKANAVNGKHKYPKALKEYFAKGHSSDNPVLVAINFKQNLSLSKPVYASSTTKQ